MLGEPSPFCPHEPREDSAEFSVVDRSSGELVGAALLWGIDNHNRAAHLGISTRPQHWDKGYGTDVLRVLCAYGFSTRGLHRLQLETLADNYAMIGAAKAAGFVLEGTQRESSWVSGEFLDDVIFGLVIDDWTPSAPV